mmetsp:Transcript_97469/g.280525  ORF Transcript_97469/g.280525 Transcript_97469/m.280525 type:complete len:273 (-) Transcript_97469:11-829(-)
MSFFQATQTALPMNKPPTTKRTSLPWKAPTFAQIGPGHMPQRPQPKPKIAVPMMSSRSTGSAFDTKPNLPPSKGTGELRRSTIWKKGMENASAPPMTKASAGSHAPEPKSMKPTTLLARDMPLTPSPTPKLMPLRRHTMTCNLLLLSGPIARCAAVNKAALTAKDRTTVALQIAARCTFAASRSQCKLGGMYETPWRKVAEIAPKHMKHGTPTQDRSASRARPVKPWPEVQPLPKAVPTPTRTPPMRSRAMYKTCRYPERSTWGGSGSNAPS